jgi:hypothetical protein
MARVAVAINNNVSAAYLDQLLPSVRLYPTGLEELFPGNNNNNSTDGGGKDKSKKKKRVAFKAVFEDVAPAGLDPEGAEERSFVTDCATWVGVTAVVYASKPLDLFVFEFDEDGKVEAVVNEALRVRLEKVD